MVAVPIRASGNLGFRDGFTFEASVLVLAENTFWTCHWADTSRWQKDRCFQHRPHCGACTTKHTCSTRMIKCPHKREKSRAGPREVRDDFPRCCGQTSVLYARRAGPNREHRQDRCPPSRSVCASTAV